MSSSTWEPGYVIEFKDLVDVRETFNSKLELQAKKTRVQKQEVDRSTAGSCINEMHRRYWPGESGKNGRDCMYIFAYEG